nr:uncharacterized mitochondrial protein AtMg00810-like [Tanacetum cinerariifolium]
MVPPNNLGPDLSGKSVNETKYRGMIGSLMDLTARRPNIQFSTCLCVRYQANPKESHLITVKRIFRYLKGKAPQEAFTRAPTRFKEFLSEFRYTTKTLEDSKVWVCTPIGGVRGDKDESEEEEANKEDTQDTSHDMPEDTSVPPPPSLKLA